MDKKTEVLRVLLRHYTKIGRNGGISKVIFNDEFEQITEEIVKLFDLPLVSEQLAIRNVPPRTSKNEIN